MSSIPWASSRLRASTLVILVSAVGTACDNITAHDDAPTVIAVTPLNEATGVTFCPSPTVTFSKPMDPSSLDITLRHTASGITIFSVTSYDAATNTATVRPVDPVVNTDLKCLSSQTNYTVTVAAGARDLGGNALANAYTWSFTTEFVDLIPPTVTAVSPANGSVGVAVNTAVNITFSESINANTINGTNISLRKTSTNETVPGSVSYDAGTHVATITPAAPLSEGTGYTVRVFGVKDDSRLGNQIASAFTSTFTTAAAGSP